MGCILDAATSIRDIGISGIITEITGTRTTDPTIGHAIFGMREAITIRLLVDSVGLAMHRCARPMDYWATVRMVVVVWLTVATGSAAHSSVRQPLPYALAMV